MLSEWTAIAGQEWRMDFCYQEYPFWDAGRPSDAIGSVYRCWRCFGVFRRLKYVKKTHRNMFKRGHCEVCWFCLGPTELQKRAAAVEKRARDARRLRASPQSPKSVSFDVLRRSYGKS